MIVQSGLGVDLAPMSLEDLGVNRDLVSSLVLRTLAAAGRLTGRALEERLGVRYEAIREVIDELVDLRGIELVGHAMEEAERGRPPRFAMHHAISSAGRARAAELATTGTSYLGRCPVSLETYLELVAGYGDTSWRIDREALQRAMRGLELDPTVVAEVGSAMTSRSSIFLYGPPGNGKSTIARRMSELLGGPIEIPHAVAVGEEVIRLYDPVYHGSMAREQPADRRIRRVRRPLVRAGGELQLSQLELTYDPRARYYEAPLQWKANGGLLVIDDFGRQAESPSRLLNRFIIPMEEGVDYLDLAATGQKIEVPFTCQMVFSTNLSPAHLVDEAFLRRISYKVLVDDPSPEAYARIFARECERQGLAFDPGVILHLFSLYRRRGMPMRGSHPRQLVARIVDRARYEGTQPTITSESVERAFDAYLNPAFQVGPTQS